MSVPFPANALPPSPGTTKTKDDRKLKAEFGDGYSLRVLDGLNSDIELWSMVWNNLTRAEKNVICDFLDARAGVEPFMYTMPGDEVEKQWICEGGYKLTPDGYNNFSITATFDRDYSL